MGYKDLLVYLDPTPASGRRLDLALEIAAREGGYVTAIDASTDDAFEGSWRNRAVEVEGNFAAALAAAAVPGEFHVVAERGAWAAAEVAVPADLVIAPAPAPELRRLVHPGLPEEAIRHAGAPVLVVPGDWAGGPLGRDVVVAWNGSREARRAVRDAMPLLRRANRVTVFVHSSSAGGLRAGAERLVAHLARHDVAADVSDWTHTGDISAVEALFASIDTQSADLLVSGAFGHSGLYEALFGSVSRDLLRQPVLPVLMSY